MTSSQRKTIFITGAGSGIGRAVARKFAGEGWFVGLADISEAGLRETAALLPSGLWSSHPLDVRDRAGWDAALSACAAAAGGRIDAVFNNAGIPIGGKLTELGADEIERALDINLKGAIFGAAAAYPWLKASAPGSCLLSTASAAGIYGTPGAAVYSPLLDHAPNRASNEDIRGRVTGAGLEITPVEAVADAAWAAVHGNRLHTLVGKTARQLNFAAKWLPGRLRAQTRKSQRTLGG